jgi:phenylacetate-CoA ligase
MKNYIDIFYYKSPVIIQNLIVSIYGYKLFRERYIGNYPKYFRQILRSQWFTKEEINNFTNKRFFDIITIVANSVPYYRNFFELNISLFRNLKNIEDIKYLPIIRKEQIRDNSFFFLNQNFLNNKFITINTSGTTGKTLKIYVDYDSRRYGYAFFSRLKDWARIDCKRPNVTFAGRAIVEPDRNTPPFWRRNLKMNNYLFSSYHLSPANLGSYVQKLQAINPHFIDSYPSSVYTLAHYMLENKLGGIRPKAIITSSETLLDYQREAIEQAFHCPVFDQYGCAEQVVFISQCEHGTYHIHPEYGYVEFLREDGSAAEPGEEARLICTGFTNRAMPLIRYDIGDTGILAKDQTCPCGRNFPVIEKIVGRTDDFLVMRDGRRVGRLDPVFKGLQTIKESQIVQEDLDRVTLKIVPGQDYDQNEADIIVHELKKRLGTQAAISVELVESIPRTSAGKFRAVVSKVNKLP